MSGNKKHPKNQRKTNVHRRSLAVATSTQSSPRMEERIVYSHACCCSPLTGRATPTKLLLFPKLGVDSAEDTHACEVWGHRLRCDWSAAAYSGMHCQSGFEAGGAGRSRGRTRGRIGQEIRG